MTDLEPTNPSINPDPPEEDVFEKPSGLFLLVMSVISSSVYIFLAWLVFRFVLNVPFSHVFQSGFSVPLQIGIGTICGTIAAGVVGFVMFRAPVADILKDYAIVRLISGIRFTAFDRIQVSLFAGFGEELLFRGALQPVFGIWLTSILFVGLHGYFKFTSRYHLVFGGMMFGLSAGLGLLFEWAGIVAAITAHAVYDMLMLQAGHSYGFGKPESDNHR
jgi:uncharacterized protein